MRHMHLATLLILALSLPAFGQATREDLDWEYDWWDDSWEAHVEPENFPQYRELEDQYVGADWEYDYLQNEYELEVPDVDDGFYDDVSIYDPYYYTYDDEYVGPYPYDNDIADYETNIQDVMSRIDDFAVFEGSPTEREYDWWEGEYSLEVPSAKTAQPPIDFIAEQPTSVDFDDFGDEWTWQFGPSAAFSQVEAQYDDGEDVWEYSFTPRTYETYGYYDDGEYGYDYDYYDFDYDTDEDWFEDWYWY